MISSEPLIPRSVTRPEPVSRFTSPVRFDTVTFARAPRTGFQFRHNRSVSGATATGLSFLITPDSGSGWYIELEGTSTMNVYYSTPEPLEGPDAQNPTYIRFVPNTSAAPVLNWNFQCYGPSLGCTF